MADLKSELLADTAKDRSERRKKRSDNSGVPSSLPWEFDQRFDDVATAERFLADFGDDLCYQAESRKWMVWNGKHWQEDKKEAVFGLALAFVKDLYSPENLVSSDSIKYARRANSASGLNAFLSIVAKKKTLPITVFDTQPYLINCANGLLDLRTGDLKPHDRNQLITKLVDCDYDPEAPCPTYDRFLETIQPDPTIRAFLQRSVGYSLLGTVRERAFWILYGIGNNGKSVFLNLFNNLLGDYGSGTTASSIMASKQAGGIPNDIARLNGKRFVIIPETEENERLNAALVKALSSGDTVTARFLFGEYFDFPFTGKLWIATNHKPTITDHSKGFWDRLKVVPFAQNIPSDKIIKSDDLMSQLLSEASGIFAWAVMGCRDYFEVDGLDTPPVIRAEIDSYRWEQDSIAQFLESRCETVAQAQDSYPDRHINDLDYRVANSDLYKAYKKFCEENGEYLRSHRKFTQNMRERGFHQGRDTERFWEGVRLMSSFF